MALFIRSPEDIESMGRAGRVLWAILSDVAAGVRPGLSTGAAAELIERRILTAGAEPVMKHAGFPAAASVCVNEEASHGVPGSRLIRDGDLLTLDAALRLDGWCADAAIPVPVGAVSECRRRVASAASVVTSAGVAECRAGRLWSEVVRAMHEAAGAVGVRIAGGCDGHGIGRDLHEPPVAWNLEKTAGHPGLACKDFVLRPGLVITIEPVVVSGGPETTAQDDGWTILVADRGDAAHEERTVAVTRAGPVMLTAA